MTRASSLFALLTSLAGLFACAQSQQLTPPPGAQFDGGGLDASAPNPVTGSSDGGTNDFGNPSTCVVGAVQQAPCGKCGNHARTCGLAPGEQSAHWGDWSACQNELTGSNLCSYGDTRTYACGHCGVATDACDPMTCTWTLGMCQGEGCKVGEYDTSFASCTVQGTVRSRQCMEGCVWGPYSACDAPKGWKPMASAPAGFAARIWAASVWTGTEMIVWGGFPQDPGPLSYIAESSVVPRTDGAAYNPKTDTWRILPPIPSVYSGDNYGTVAVWTGKVAIFWGGANRNTGDGLAYDPAANAWKVTAAAPMVRAFPTAVWSTTTSRMLVWGGDPLQGRFAVNNGAEYDPATDTWAALPMAPFDGRLLQTGIWTGTEMIVWGGKPLVPDNFQSSPVPILPLPGASYEPVTRTWTTMAAFPSVAGLSYYGSGLLGATAFGSELFTWGGALDDNSDAALQQRQPPTGVIGGAVYLPDGGWAPVSPIPADAWQGHSVPVVRQQAWAGGGRFWMWSGRDVTNTPVPAGVWYDPALDTWGAMPQQGAPDARYGATVVWADTQAILWSGVTATGAAHDGARYVP